MNPKRQNTFSTSIYDEELTEGVTYLYTRDTNLSHDIIVDCGETYIYYHHALCMYVVEGEKVHPVLISPNPSTIEDYNIPDDIRSFITQHITLLTDLADLKISGGTFFKALEDAKN